VSTIKFLLLPAALCLFLTGCILFGANESEGHITKDFYLKRWDERDREIIFNVTRDPLNENVAIQKNAFAVGHSSDFIIAKQHPYKDQEVYSRLFSERNFRWHYELKDPADTIFLIREDSIYTENDKWYHKLDRWTSPDSLKPYKKLTNYFIIDLRNYNEGYKLYKFESEEDFNNKRVSLGVPADLTYSFYDKALE